MEAVEVLGRLADEVRERVLAAPDWAGRFAVLEEFRNVQAGLHGDWE
jgi:hypothetical protein